MRFLRSQLGNCSSLGFQPDFIECEPACTATDVNRTATPHAPMKPYQLHRDSNLT